MSQYLQVSIRKKGETNGLTLFWVCTTPARQLSNLGAFPFTEKDVLLDKKDYENYLDIIKGEVVEMKVSQKRLKEDYEDLQKLLPQATNKEVYEAMRSDAYDSKYQYESYDDEIESYEKYLSQLQFAWDIYDDNKEDDYELYYTNC